MLKEYKEKLARRNDALLKLWKLRFLLAAIAILLVALSVVLALVGSVHGETWQDNIVYGQQPDFSASAFLGETHFEYRAVGGQWSDSIPKDVGEYQARAVSQGIAGRPRYGKVLSFAIIPCNINVKVTDAELLYGQNPVATADNLRYGDVLQCDAFDYSYGDKTVTVTPKDAQIAVFSADGADVTANYRINPVSKTIILQPLEITISTESRQWIYDGKDHDYPQVSAEGLLSGHYLTDVKTISVRDVCQVDNNVESYKILDEDGADVTKFYDVSWQFGTVEVTRRKAQITTNSAQFTYDGTARENRQFSCEQFAAGHSVEVFGWTSITDVGERQNSATDFKVTDESGSDVTGNYDVTFSFGTLSVSVKRLEVTTHNAEFVYDGQSHTAEQADFVGLVHGHVATLGKWNSAVDSGTVDNVCQLLKVTDGVGKDVTSNYVPAFSYGSLTILPRLVKISTDDAIFVYDGTAKQCAGFTAQTQEECEGLLPDHKITSVPTSVSAVTDKDGVAFAENIHDFTIYSGAADVSQNYKIEATWGKIRIKSPIVVRVFALSKLYDGSALSYRPDDYEVESCPVDVPKDYVHVSLYGSQTSVGTLSLSQLRANSVVSVTDSSGKDLLSDPADPNRVDFTGSALTVLARPLTVVSASVSAQKGMVPLFGNVTGAAWIASGSLLSGHTIAYTVTGMLPFSQQSAPNTFTVKISDSSGKDVTDCYDVTYKFGTLSWAA